ncbi:MAG: acyl-CoA dehydrogenase family protein [Burkholderiales bacterium]|nr:acyl-CoA dehydrogenase family protein [Burkholderiales bacterium]
MDRTYLDWPFFDPAHRRLADEVDAWAAHALDDIAHADTGAQGRATVDAACRTIVARLGSAGITRHAVPAAHGGASAVLDSRSLCVIREHLAYHDGLADFAFAMQGLGSGVISLAGSDELKRRWLPKVARGEAIAAFALSEPDAGSDVGAMTTRARRDGDSFVIDGAKTWISNGGIADFYVVFLRTDPESRGAKGISALLVEADSPGLAIAERIDVIAPHPLATLRFDACRVPATHLLGEEGQGFKLAMGNLDIFRSSVAAAALGFARRAMDEAVARAKSRPMFGAKLADLQLTQAAIGDMATMIDAAALLTYRAAWLRDRSPTSTGQRTTREAAMAKMTATENAQAVIDRAVQLFGGLGVTSGVMVERLYREIRALRIYEGATEVQKVIIARETLK